MLKTPMGIELFLCLEYKPTKQARYISFHQQQVERDYAFFSFFNPGFIREEAGRHPIPVRGIPEDASFQYLSETLLPATKKAGELLFPSRKKTLIKPSIMEKHVDGHRSFRIKVEDQDFITNPEDWGHSFMTAAEWQKVSKSSKNMSKEIQFEMGVINELMQYFKEHNTPCRVSFFFRG